MTNDISYTINIWIHALEGYEFDELITKPSPDQWSLGQVYMHLLDDTRYYLEQIEICVKSNDHMSDEAVPFARTMLTNNEFPDTLLKGAPDHSSMPQPASKEQLLRDFIKLKADLNNAVNVISESLFHGKTKHPGFNYFNANEWLQFADMHFRHHLRQKRRIDEFLNMS